jgi:DNA-binding transcriptional LysR family regulator
MDIKWLEDFLSLCQSGNFRVSSEQRCISQPAFSRRIKALETWVGAELIHRTSHPVHLTDAGKEFKSVAEEIVWLAYQARDDNRALDLGKEVVIHFSTLSTLAQFFIPGWLKGLKAHIETEQFNVRTDFASIDDYLGGLADGIVDFFIGYEDPSGSDVIDPEKYSSLHLGEESLVPVVSPDGKGKPMWWLPSKPQGAIPYLHTNSSLSLWPIRKHLEKHYGDLTFTPVYESSIATALKAMAIEGYGVAWIPKSIVVDDLANGRLVRAAEEKDDIAVDIKIYRNASSTDPKVEKFWQVLMQQQN